MKPQTLEAFIKASSKLVNQPFIDNMTTFIQNHLCDESLLHYNEFLLLPTEFSPKSLNNFKHFCQQKGIVMIMEANLPVKVPTTIIIHDDGSFTWREILQFENGSFYDLGTFYDATKAPSKFLTQPGH